MAPSASRFPVPGSLGSRLESLAWSAVHGLAMLLIDGTLRSHDHTHAIAQRLLDHVEQAL